MKFSTRILARRRPFWVALGVILLLAHAAQPLFAVCPNGGCEPGDVTMDITDEDDNARSAFIPGETVKLVANPSCMLFNLDAGVTCHWKVDGQVVAGTGLIETYQIPADATAGAKPVTLCVDGIAAEGQPNAGQAICRTVNGSFDVTIPELSLADELWWFNGEIPSASSSYHVETDLILQGCPPDIGQLTVSVTEGADLVDLNAGSGDADTLDLNNWGNVKVKSTGGSSAPKDIKIDVTHANLVVASFRFKTRMPTTLSPLIPSFQDENFENGYQSTLFYQLLDQFGGVLPGPIYVSEDFQDDHQPTPTNGISDWTIANGRPENENWGWALENNRLINPGEFGDVIRRSGTSKIPLPENPHGGNDKIDHEVGGIYISPTEGIGKGVRVKGITWQIYRDHGRHE